MFTQTMRADRRILVRATVPHPARLQLRGRARVSFPPPVVTGTVVTGTLASSGAHSVRGKVRLKVDKYWTNV